MGWLRWVLRGVLVFTLVATSIMVLAFVETAALPILLAAGVALGAALGIVAAWKRLTMRGAKPTRDALIDAGLLGAVIGVVGVAALPASLPLGVGAAATATQATVAASGASAGAVAMGTLIGEMHSEVQKSDANWRLAEEHQRQFQRDREARERENDEWWSYRASVAEREPEFLELPEVRGEWKSAPSPSKGVLGGLDAAQRQTP